MKSHALDGAPEDAGPIGPVSVFALLFLVVASPLMRGGNRHVALIVLEAAALAFLAALFFHAGDARPKITRRGALIALLASSPLWLALVYLLPLPTDLWKAVPGRSLYAGLLEAAGLPAGRWRPLSLVPDATTTSLLAGIPLVAAFIGGLGASLPQLRRVAVVFVACAFAQVGLALLQAASGEASLHFGSTYGLPYGTFANNNHFANYVAMALAAYIWLAWMKLSQSRPFDHRAAAAHRRRLAMYAAGAMLLLVGILMSRSRGAALAGLPAALAAFAVVLTVGPRGRPLKTTLLLLAGALLAGVLLVGVDVMLSRFQLRTMIGDAGLRGLIASTTLQGAAEFWPFGAGWGTYTEVYPRFRPPAIRETVHYAHQDYAHMLFEGGIFAVVLMAAFAWLAVTRIIYLVRTATRNRRLRREEMAAAICGIGLLGFLLHSLVEFNMHIPANAIIASLFAGIFLRPLKPKEEEEAPGD